MVGSAIQVIINSVNMHEHVMINDLTCNHHTHLNSQSIIHACTCACNNLTCTCNHIVVQ